MSTGLGVVFLIGRVLFAIFFVPISGVGHIKRSPSMMGFAKGAGMPLPYLAGWPSGVWLIAGGLSVAAGLWADAGALMLSLFVALAALQFHAYWKFEDAAQRSTQRGSFFRNVSLLGASLCLFTIFASFGRGIPLTLTGPLFHLAKT